MRLTQIEQARVEAAYAAIAGAEAWRHSTVLRFLLVLDVEATADDLVEHLDCTGYDPAQEFTLEHARRYLRAARARVALNSNRGRDVLSTRDDPSVQSAIEDALPLFATAPGQQQLNQQHQQSSPTRRTIGTGGAFGTSSTALARLLEPPPRDAGVVDVSALTTAMAQLPISRELARLDSEEAAVVERTMRKQSQWSPADRQQLATMQRELKPREELTFEDFADWVFEQFAWLASEDGARAARTLQSQYASMSSGGGAAAGGTSPAVAAVGGPLAVPPGGFRNARRTSPASPTTVSARRGDGDGEEAADLGTSSSMAMSKSMATTGGGGGGGNNDLAASMSLTMGLSMAHSFRLNSSPTRSRQGGGAGAGGGSKERHRDDDSASSPKDPAAPGTSAFVRQRTEDVSRPMHERAKRPVDISVPPARRLPALPKLIRNALDQSLVHLASQQDAAVAEEAAEAGLIWSPRRGTSAERQRHQLDSPESRASKIDRVAMEELEDPDRSGQHQQQQQRPEVHRATAASTARARARQDEFPVIAVAQPSPPRSSRTQQHHHHHHHQPAAPTPPRSTPSLRHRTHTSGGTSGGSPRGQRKARPSAADDDPEVQKRQLRMAFFNNAAFYSQPFRTEFRTANLAPPADSTAMPSEAQRLAGVDPYHPSGRCDEEDVGEDQLDAWLQQ